MGVVVGSGRRFADATGLSAEAAAIGPELDAALARTGADLALPAPLALELAHAIALERREGNAARIEDIFRHYTAMMPAQRVAQLAEPDALLREPLAWDRLPRLRSAIDRLYAVLADAGVDCTPALGAPTAEAFRARTPTLAVLYSRTHYGGAMPLLYGNPDDLAYFKKHGGADLHAAIDRYLTTPILHELCHLAPGRDALHPLHIDECIAGWLGVYCHPEFAYPEVGQDDAIFAAPWLSQIGQAFARAFGIRPLVRAHAGAEPWDAALPAAFVEAAARLGWEDWRVRRTLHFLSDTMDPAPWVALALVAGAGRSLAGMSLATLAATPLVELAGELPADPAFDRAIVEDAVRAMCLDNALIDRSLRARTSLPDTPIAIDARACTVIGVRRGDVDAVAPRYWLPPAVGARILATGASRYTLRLHDLAALPAVAIAIDEARPGAHSGFELVAE